MPKYLVRLEYDHVDRVIVESDGPLTEKEAKEAAFIAYDNGYVDFDAEEVQELLKDNDFEGAERIRGVKQDDAAFAHPELNNGTSTFVRELKD